MSNHIIKNRFGIYYYRITTPLDIQQLVPKLKKDVRISLRTRSVRLAHDNSALYHADISNFFRLIRAMTTSTKHSKDHPLVIFEGESEEMQFARSLVKMAQKNGNLKKFCAVYESRKGRKVTLKSFELDTIEKINMLLEAIQYASSGLDDPDSYLNLVTVKPLKEKSLAGYDIQADVAIKGIRKLKKNELHESELQQIRRFERDQFGQAIAFIATENVYQREASFIVSTPTEDVLVDGLKTDGKESDLDSLCFLLGPHFSQFPTQQSVIHHAVTPAINVNTGFIPRRYMTFSEAAKAYFPQRISGLKGRYGVTRVNAAIHLFIEVLGDLSLEQVTQEHVDDLLAILNVLPPNRNKNPLYRTLSARELAAQYKPGNEQITAGGRVHYVNEWRGIFALAVERGYCEHNFFETPGLVKVKRDKGAEKAGKTSRRFRDSELLEIFDNPNFTKLGANRSWHFWIPLICLYTGARVGEVAQLNWSDVRKEQNIWVLDINTIDSENSVKTESSKRCIPIHDDLLALGLVELADAMRLSFKQSVHSCEKLFWEMKKGADKWSHDPSKWFTNTFFKTLSFKRPGDKFHAFRHTFTDLLKNAGVDESTYGALLGHNVSLRSGGMYGDLHALSTLKQAINKAKPLPKKSIEKLTPYRLPKEFISVDKRSSYSALIDQAKTIRRDKYLLERFFAIAGPKSMLFTDTDYIYPHRT